MPDPTAALRAFERALEDLITVLEDAATPAAALELASGRCVAAFDAVRAHEADLTTGPGSAQLRRSRERIAILHALARQAAESAAATTGHRVTQARDARRALANLRDH